MIRVKFSFHESSYDTLSRLAAEKGVREAEIVRRALSLYASCNKRLKEFPVCSISQESFKELHN